MLDNLLSFLLIEDNPFFYLPITEYLTKYEIKYTHVDNLEVVKDIFESDKYYDAVLTDFHFYLLNNSKEFGISFKGNFGNFVGLYYKFIKPENSRYVIGYSNDFNKLNRTFFDLVLNKQNYVHNHKFLISVFFDDIDFFTKVFQRHGDTFERYRALLGGKPNV